MKTIIFKSEKKAKVYRILSSINQGVYKTGELIQLIKTDDITKHTDNWQYLITVQEVQK